MTINDIIAYAKINNITLDAEIMILSESLISDNETALIKDSVSVGILSDKSNKIVFVPYSIAHDSDIKKELKRQNIDNIASAVNSKNIEISVTTKEINADVIKKILEKELKFKEFAEISITNEKIFIQVSDKVKTDRIKKRFDGYSVYFDKLNSIWFDSENGLDYYWKFGKKVCK